MRLSLPAALAVALVPLSAAPAAAADGFMSVQDFQFAPETVQVNPGEKVDFNFEGPTVHTATLRAGQTDRYDSGFVGAGYTRSYRFRYPGRFRLFCIPHPGMTAAVLVGAEESVKPRLTGLRAAPDEGRARLTFRLSERAVVTFASGKTRVRKTFGAGRRGFTIRGLARGRRTVRVAARDGWANRSAVARRSFSVR